MNALALAADGREVTFSDNAPPDPFDATKVHADDLLDQSRGVTAVTSAEQLESVKTLEGDLRDAADLLEQQRVAKKKPLDDEITEIQATFNVYLAPLTNKTVKGKIPLALDALKKAKEPWLKALEDKRLAEAAEAQKKADEAAEAARQALQAAAPEDMEAREEAEALITVAQTAARVAVRTTTAASRGSGLRSYWTPELTDSMAALRHYMVARADALREFLLEQARKDIQASIRTIPGFTITEERRA